MYCFCVLVKILAFEFSGWCVTDDTGWLAVLAGYTPTPTPTRIVKNSKLVQLQLRLEQTIQ